MVGYKTLLQQLFLNMLTNSLKYTKEKKPIIEIGVSEDSHYWIFFIRDNGIGIEKQYHEEIFVIFKRLHNNSEYSGTGIGLSICKKIIEAHNGKIWVESSIDKGSTFYFTISKNINHEKSKHIIN
jgi:light-regulated signal transduction histidine kinase (bacteriophytochrome)